MSTKIRSSQQLYVDDNLNVNSKKVVSLLAGSADTDGVNVGQMNTAITNAVSGLGNSIHVPVADLAAAKAVNAAGRADKMIMLIETLGLYRFDAESTAVSNDDTVIRPTDVATDAAAGRWVKMSSTITDHNNLSNKQGGTTAEYYHLTNTELTKLTGIEAAADVTDAANVGSSIHGATAKATPVDADTIPLIDSAAANVLKKVTWANIKATLKTYFDTLYTNVVKNTGAEIDTGTDDAKFATAKSIRDSGLISGAVSGEIAALTDKATPVDADVTMIEDSAATNAKKKLTWANIKATLETYFNTKYVKTTARTYRATPTGTPNGSLTDFVIAATILTGTEEVFLNGLLMNAGAGNDYTIVAATPSAGNTTIRFVTAPLGATGGSTLVDVILVNYSV